MKTPAFPCIHATWRFARGRVLGALVLSASSLFAQDGCGVEDPDSSGPLAATSSACPAAAPSPTPYVPGLAWSTGTKTLICIRVSFSGAGCDPLKNVVLLEY